MTIDDAEELESSALRVLWESGRAGFETRLRDALASAGGPLVEPLADDAHRSLVTFAWLGDDDTKSVRLHSKLSNDRVDLHRIGGTNAWQRSFKVDNHVRTSYQFFPNQPEMEFGIAEARDPEASARYFAMLAEGVRADPANPAAMIPQAVPAGYPRERWESVLSMPGACVEPWLAEQPGIARGEVDAHTFASPSLGNSRRAWVYTPPGFSRDDALPSLTLLDGRAFRWSVPTQTIMDNLIAAGAVPPMVVCMLDNPTAVSRLTEYECNVPFADMLADEVVPWLRGTYGVSTDPARTIIGGVSYGGLGSGFAAFHRPDIFGNVLSMSGSYWWGPDEEGAEWLTQQVAAAPATDVRWYLDAGSLETMMLIPPAGANMVAVSRHLRDVLVAKRAPVTFNTFGGGHEFCCWRQSLADGLRWLTAEWG